MKNLGAAKRILQHHYGKTLTYREVEEEVVNLMRRNKRNVLDDIEERLYCRLVGAGCIEDLPYVALLGN